MTYRVIDSNGRCHESERLADMKTIAEQRLMGLPYDSYVIIEKYCPDGGGFWEPSHRVERDLRGRIVCR